MITETYVHGHTAHTTSLNDGAELITTSMHVFQRLPYRQWTRMTHREAMEVGQLTDPMWDLRSHLLNLRGAWGADYLEVVESEDGYTVSLDFPRMWLNMATSERDRFISSIHQNLDLVAAGHGERMAESYTQFGAMTYDVGLNEDGSLAHLVTDSEGRAPTQYYTAAIIFKNIGQLVRIAIPSSFVDLRVP